MNNESANAKDILRTYQAYQEEDEQHSLAAKVYSLTAKYRALQQDYEHLVRQVKYLRR